MSGRSRRATTTSAVPPASRSSIPWRLETKLLRMIEPDVTEDKIETFELVDAEVLSADGKTLANPLDLQLHGPFMVRGFLMIDEDEQRERLIRPDRKKNHIPIQINNVERYTVGLAEEQEGSFGFYPPLLWLKGKCAFYEFKPAQHYLPIHRQINEAIDMYYSFEVYYSSNPKRAMGSSTTDGTLRVEPLAPLFLHCALELGNGWTMEDVTQKCHDLAHFLISRFFTTTDISWQWDKTYFHQWMQQEHTDLFRRLKDAYVNGQPQVEKHPSDLQRSASLSLTPAPASRLSRVQSSEPALVEESIKQTAKISAAKPAPASRRQRSTRSRSLLSEDTHILAERPAPKPKMAPASSTPISLAQASTASPAIPDDHVEPFESLQIALEDVFDHAKTTAKLTDQYIANKIFFDYRWPNYKNGQSGCHRIPVIEVFHYNASQLLKVLDKRKWGATQFWSWLEAKAGEPFQPAALTPDRFPYPLVRRKKMENTVRKAQPPQPKMTASVHSDSYGGDESDDHHPSGPGTPGRGMGKTPARLGKSVLRPASSVRKRTLESDSEEGSPVAKRSHYFDGDTEDDHQVVNDDQDDDEDDQIQLAVRADRIPSTTPRGPDGTWTCDEEGCNYIVRGGDAEECKKRIDQHLATHEKEAERVQLAIAEGAKNHSSISHLLDRIREHGEKSQEKEQLSLGGMTLPKPIQRKVMV